LKNLKASENVFSEQIRHRVFAIIKNLYLIKGYGPRRLISEFPGKGQKRSGLYTLGEAA